MQRFEEARMLQTFAKTGYGSLASVPCVLDECIRPCPCSQAALKEAVARKQTKKHCTWSGVQPKEELVRKKTNTSSDALDAALHRLGEVSCAASLDRTKTVDVQLTRL